MKKQSLVLTLAALACTAAFAQAPAGVVATPSAQASPTTSGGTPAAKAEMKVDAKKANGSTLQAQNPVAGSGGAAANAQINPSASGGTPAAKAEMKVDSKVNNTAMNTMDTNGDGMVSSKEWNRYQTAMWKSMKPTKNGMVPMTDVDMMMKGTPK
jgi:peptidoglycan hydrolase-like protein with peptidoglycan-binding domain